MRFGILGMRPAYTEIRALVEIRAAPFSCDVVGIVHGETSVEFVVDTVTGVDVNCPGTQGEKVAGYRKVQVIPENEVHSSVFEVKTSCGLFAESRDQKSCGTFRALGNESERNTDKRQMDVFNHYVRGAENDLLRGIGNHLGSGKLQIVVRMVGVAHRIFSLGYIDGLVRHHLDVFAVQDAVVLGSYHILDTGLARIEIIAQFLHVVFLGAFLHHRPAYPFAGKGIVHAVGIDGARIHVVFHPLGGQLHVLVGNFNVAVVIYQTVPVFEMFDDGVPGSGECRGAQRTFLHERC